MLETLALAHYQAGDYAAAAEHARIAGRLTGAASAVLAASLARLGQIDEAAQAFARSSRTKRSAQRPMAAPYAVPAHLEHLRDGYRLAGNDGVELLNRAARPAGACRRDSGS